MWLMASNVLAVRDLGLSAVLQRVRAGEHFQITEQDQPVALLTPVPADSRSLLDRLIASGQVTPPQADFCELGPPPERSAEISISEALQEQRARPQ
jgi:antitoxin (DNA-binding transcriptional repressor) of toxin-antitoxin stability system